MGTVKKDSSSHAQGGDEMLAACSNNKAEIMAQILKLEGRAPHCTWDSSGAG